MISAKKILFIVRIDADRKGGGDLVQAQEYKLAIESNLHECQVFMHHETDNNQLTSTHWDCVHLFNISRLQENMAILKKITYTSLVICPILQPGFRFKTIDNFKYAIKSIISKKTPTLTPLSKIKNFLFSADGFVFLSASERDAFLEKFNEINGKAYCIFENGINPITPPTSSTRIIDFICVGRVEPKKRTIETIDLISATTPGALLMCVGALNWYHPVYCLKFLFRIALGKTAYMGRVQQSRAHDLMKTSKTLINLSELEVSPLVDLEALACGCNVISTNYSYAHLAESSNYKRIDVKDTHACKEAISTPFSPTALNLASPNLWIENSKNYTKMVSQIIKNKKSP